MISNRSNASDSKGGRKSLNLPATGRKSLVQPATGRNRSSFVSPRKQRDVDAARTDANSTSSEIETTISVTSTIAKGNDTVDDVVTKDNTDDCNDVASTTAQMSESEDVPGGSTTNEIEATDVVPTQTEDDLTHVTTGLETTVETGKIQNEIYANDGKSRKKLSRLPPDYPPAAEIFKTSKLFWQVKKTLDIHLFLHDSEEKVVEILAIGDNSAPGEKESHIFSRSYLNYRLVYRLMKRLIQEEEEKQNTDELADKVKNLGSSNNNNTSSKGVTRLSALDSLKMQSELEAAKASIQRKRKERGTLEEDLEKNDKKYREKMRTKLCDHIVERLKITETSPKRENDIITMESNNEMDVGTATSVSKTVKQLEYVVKQNEMKLLEDCTLPNDDGKKGDASLQFTLTEIPWYIKPATIKKKKMSTMQDRDAIMHALSTERAKLKEATSMAESAMKLINMSVKVMSAVAKRSTLLRTSNYSKWRKKWIWAIRRVIAQLAVAKYEAMWVAYCKKREDGLSSITDRTGLSILVVDDTYTVLKKVKHALENCKHNVTIAENGLVALKLMKEIVYDLVLMDKEMPTMNGFQSTQEIRAFERENPERKKQFIICITDEIEGKENELLLKTRDCGMDGLLIKPFTVQALDQTLEKLSNERKTSPALQLGTDVADDSAMDKSKANETRSAQKIQI